MCWGCRGLDFPARGSQGKVGGGATGAAQMGFALVVCQLSLGADDGEDKPLFAHGSLLALAGTDRSVHLRKTESVPRFDASALGGVCAVREESPSSCHALVMLSVADACSVKYSAPSIRSLGTSVSPRHLL